MGFDTVNLHRPTLVSGLCSREVLSFVAARSEGAGGREGDAGWGGNAGLGGKGGQVGRSGPTRRSGIWALASAAASCPFDGL